MCLRPTSSSCPAGRARCPRSRHRRGAVASPSARDVEVDDLRLHRSLLLGAAGILQASARPRTGSCATCCRSSAPSRSPSASSSRQGDHRRRRVGRHRHGAAPRRDGSRRRRGARAAARIEYDPDPPFDSGSFEKADAETQRRATAHMMPGSEQAQAPHDAAFDVVVVGGGQAGLAIGYFLAQQGRRFTILEAADAPAAAWRARWDSLKLFTPGALRQPARAARSPATRTPTRAATTSSPTSPTTRGDFELPVELNSRVRAVRPATTAATSSSSTTAPTRPTRW